jgi:hypothetical protein
MNRIVRSLSFSLPHDGDDATKRRSTGRTFFLQAREIATKVWD